MDDETLWTGAVMRSMVDSGERHTLEDVAAQLGVDLTTDATGSIVPQVLAMLGFFALAAFVVWAANR